MIFVTLGSQKFQFNRILKEIDYLIEKNVIQEKVFAQIGASTYSPKLYEYKNFLNQNEFNQIMNQSSLVITHAGTGAIITALKSHKKVIAIPRLCKYNEHVDDHQLQILEVFTSQNYIYGITDIKKLEEALIDIKKKNFCEFKSNNLKFLENLEKELL